MSRSTYATNAKAAVAAYGQLDRVNPKVRDRVNPRYGWESAIALVG